METAPFVLTIITWMIVEEHVFKKSAQFNNFCKLMVDVQTVSLLLDKMKQVRLNVLMT
jgi:hypothetical protein